MSARIIQFPARRLVQDGEGLWLVLAWSSGWLLGNRADAFQEAQWLAENLALPLRASP
jgi:hypothetical protein